MKVTGIVLLVMSAGMALYGAMLAMALNAPASEARQPNQMTSTTDLWLPFLGAIFFGLIGLAVLLYGGKGYFVSNNPEVRN
jgi:hypothetical protein